MDSPSAAGRALSAAELRQLLQHLTQAFSSGNPERLHRLVDHASPVKVELATALVNAQQVGLVGIAFEVDETAAPAGPPKNDSAGWQGPVSVTWRLAGYDAGLARAEVELGARIVDGRAQVVSLAGRGRRPLWLGGEALAVRRLPHAAVLAPAGSPQLDRLSAQAERAAEVVRRAVPWWHGRLVVEVPGDSGALAAALDAGPDEFASLAAVTSTVDGRLSASSPIHVLLNPAVFGTLSRQGALAVLTHEATHVATAAPISTKVPPWLAEGFADHVALQQWRVSPREASANAVAVLRTGGLARRLPGEGEFGAEGQELQAAYESARVACEVLVLRAGGDALVRLYAAVADGQPLDRALETGFGLTERRLVELWWARLAHLAR